MPVATSLSSKLGLVEQEGFALRQNRQAGYQFKWHTHDCAMLLWPQFGGLSTSWLDQTGEQLSEAHTVKLVRNAAILLPPNTAHRTTSVTGRQHHAELYLAPELLRNCRHSGAVLLDGAAVAMLDALVAPSLSRKSTTFLVSAIITQLASARPLAPAAGGPSLAQKMVRCFAKALQLEVLLPSVNAVASELGVSIRQLQRACKQEMLESPVTVRRRLLASQARRLMTEEGLSLADASERLGFSTSGHLTRLLHDVGS
ncbi:helix-turn-helix domain-containing protein [Rhodoferax ferrireducens]|uniref:helix-turn-helix domain-containing protein n=1 Tax=Rhodoferax ferrireducens TaxID=192843 RepID=UPI000E0CEE4A|nr:helix-turn-helix domain-containing protein [Rhodoferax ferrireducens]